MRLPAAGHRHLLWSGVVALLVLGGGFAAWPVLVRYARGPAASEAALEKIDVYRQVPEFSLIERSGRRISRADLEGKLWVANFIYTKCTETCPTQSLQIARLQSEFQRVADLRFVSITVDPKNDTPEVLARYAERYNADSVRWLFLTGEKREIYCLAREGFKLGVVDQQDPNPPPCGRATSHRLIGLVAALLAPPAAWATHGSQGLLIHSSRLILIDRAGVIRAYHQATDEESLKRLGPNLRKLLAKRPKRG